MGHAVANTVRVAREEDLPRLLELFYQLSQLGERPHAAARLPTEDDLRAFHAVQADERATCLVLEDEGQVVGTISLYVLPAFSHGRPFGIIENVVVDEAARGAGLGRQLMDAAESLARDRGCYKVSFTSNAKRTDAHGFYEHLGFRATHKGFTKYFD